MNIKSMEYFLEVAKSLNMTTAARRLYVSQQALSLQIKKLENYYGVALFERQPNLRLTYAGLQLVETAKAIMNENESLIKNLTEINRTRSGLLRLGMHPYSASLFFSSALPEFNQYWPNVVLHIYEGKTSSEMIQMLSTGALDLTIGRPSKHEFQDLSDYVEFNFLIDDLAYVVCSDTLLKRYFGEFMHQVKETLIHGTDLSELSQVPFILHKHPMHLRQTADDCFYSIGVKPKVCVEISNPDLMAPLYSCHMGAFLCRKTRLSSLLKMFPDCNAFPVKYKDSLIQFPIYLMRIKNKRSPAHVMNLIQLCHGLT